MFASFLQFQSNKEKDAEEVRYQNIFNKYLHIYFGTVLLERLLMFLQNIYTKTLKLLINNVDVTFK